MVVVPALNEAGNIAALVSRLQAQPCQQVIVVDNGSSDETGTLAVAAGAQVVLELRRGYGYACLAGSQAALAAGAEVVVFIDGDFSALPEELPLLLAPLAAGQADLVLGSRVLGQIQPGAMPFHQRLGNWLASRLMSALYGVAVTDLSPYRAIRAGLLSELEMQEMTYGWPTEMMVKAARRGASLLEVAVTWAPRRSGRSKVSGTFRGAALAAYYILGVTLRHALPRAGQRRLT